jgi:hypothetical protein
MIMIVILSVMSVIMSVITVVIMKTVGFVDPGSCSG